LLALTDPLGAELTASWYHRLIIYDLHVLDAVAREVLPANRHTCGSFIASDAINFIDDILSSLNLNTTYDDVDWEHDFIFGQFKQYVFSEKRRMGKILADFRYNIDQENTLTLVTGSGRPETVNIVPPSISQSLSSFVVRLASGAPLHAASHPNLSLGRSQRHS
jgi:hypothetical protein